MAHPETIPAARSSFPATELTNAFVAFLFSASAPVAIILSAGVKGGLSQATLASWIFAAFVLNGILTIVMSAIYRQPLAFLWTIPGAVLVASALQHLPFAEVIGAYLLTAALMLVLGLTGWVGAIMDRIPMPIVMGMVAGVFLSFALDWIRSFASDPWLAGAMTATFFAVSLFPAVQKRLSPIIGALIAGVCTLAFTGRTPALEHVTLATSLASPQFYAPVFSWAAAFELVLPLAVTVIAVQNAQGIAVLRNSLHRPPVNAITNACGVFSALTACLGCVSTCLAGPSNAIIASGANASRHWLAAIFLGVMVIVFGLFSPLVTQALLATPAAFVATLAGLALLRILQGAFHTAFRQHFTLGALVAFLVTLGGLPLLGIGAPFWGVVFGVATSFVLERGDFAKQPAA